MASLSTKLKVLYPDVDSTTAWELCDDSDGKGVYISKWNLDNPQPTTDELEAVEEEGTELELLHKVLKQRRGAYPSIADLVVALYDTDDKSAVEAKRAAVKAKYPKPE